MKLAVSTYSMWRWMNERGESIDSAVKKIAEFGVAGVEFAGFEPDRADPTPLRTAGRLRKVAEKAGLAVAGYCVGAELLVPQDTQRHAITRLMEHVDVARELGVRSMRHDITRGFGQWSAGVNVPKTFDGALRAVVPAIREVADYGATRGVKTSLENHGFFMQAAERVEKLIKTVKHPNFGLTLDMGNFLCVNDDPVKAVKRLAKYAVMVHAKDFHVRDKRTMPATGWFATPTRIALRGAIVGHGVIDVPAQIAHLKKAGYNGWVSLEFEGMEEPITAIRLGLDYLRKLL
jgi:sugar phosphate isomerase/epimerase